MKLESSKFVSSATEFLKKYEKLSTSDEMTPDDKFNQLGSYVQDLNSAMRWLQSDMQYLYSCIAAHIDSSSHLPPCPGTSQMAKAVKALGWDEDYDVAKKVVFANNGRASNVIFNLTPVKK